MPESLERLQADPPSEEEKTELTILESAAELGIDQKLMWQLVKARAVDTHLGLGPTRRVVILCYKSDLERLRPGIQTLKLLKAQGKAEPTKEGLWLNLRTGDDRQPSAIRDFGKGRRNCYPLQEAREVFRDSNEANSRIPITRLSNAIKIGELLNDASKKLGIPREQLKHSLSDRSKFKEACKKLNIPRRELRNALEHGGLEAFRIFGATFDVVFERDIKEFRRRTKPAFIDRTKFGTVSDFAKTIGLAVIRDGEETLHKDRAREDDKHVRETTEQLDLFVDLGWVQRKFVWIESSGRNKYGEFDRLILEPFYEIEPCKERWNADAKELARKVRALVGIDGIAPETFREKCEELGITGERFTTIVGMARVENKRIGGRNGKWMYFRVDEQSPNRKRTRNNAKHVEKFLADLMAKGPADVRLVHALAEDFVPPNQNGPAQKKPISWPTLAAAFDKGKYKRIEWAFGQSCGTRTFWYREEDSPPTKDEAQILEKVCDKALEEREAEAKVAAAAAAAPEYRRPPHIIKYPDLDIEVDFVLRTIKNGDIEVNFSLPLEWHWLSVAFAAHSNHEPYTLEQLKKGYPPNREFNRNARANFKSLLNAKLKKVKIALTKDNKIIKLGKFTA